VPETLFRELRLEETSQYQFPNIIHVNEWRQNSPKAVYSAIFSRTVYKRCSFAQNSSEVTKVELLSLAQQNRTQH